MNIPDLNSQISKYFKWREALWLPTWNRAANEKDGLNDKILDQLRLTFFKMDLIRMYFGKPIIVNCAYRPFAYNSLPEIGGAKDSAHLYGMAVDWYIEDLDCDKIREQIMENKMLSTWGMRMERRPESNWVHTDTKPLSPGGARYFWP